MKEIRVNNYVATCYNEGEIVIDTRGSDGAIKQMNVNDGRVFLTTLELEQLLALSKSEVTPLTDRLELFLLQSTKQAGTYDPNKALTYVEEQMTMPELKQAESFLKWVFENKKKFGHGTLRIVWAEFHTK